MPCLTDMRTVGCVSSGVTYPTALIPMSSLIERILPGVVVDTVEQAQWAEKRYLWVADKKEGYLRASLIKEDGESLEVLFDDNTVQIILT